jgi:hypothetical protein
MASTVNIPVLGPTNKGTVVGVSIGGFAVAGYLIYRRVKTSKASAAATAQAAQQATGYGYGTGFYPSGYYGYGEPTYGYGASGGFPAGYYGYGTPITTPTATITTDAQWAQAAINQLTQEGYDAQTVSAALGAYLAGQPLAPTQVTIVQSAIAIEGNPPQAAPPMQIQGTPGGGTGGGQNSGKTVVTAGSHNLLWYATKYGTSESQLVAWNPNLAAFDKPRTNVPNGLTIRVG